MGVYSDTMTIEGVEEVETEMDYFSAMQRNINTGNWSLQGSHGRAMMGAIEAGYCMLGFNRAKDYYGNIIPSRGDVQEGTKGSFGFVVEAMGEDWAKSMQAQV